MIHAPPLATPARRSPPARAPAGPSGQPDGARLVLVGAAQADQRLDLFLAARLAFRRSEAQEAIEQGLVQVNGRPARSSHKVRAGDRVEVSITDAAAPGAASTDAASTDAASTDAASTDAASTDAARAAEGTDTTEEGELSMLAVAPEAIPLAVLFEDEQIIVINKPAGLVVHPAGAITGGTLANALAHRWGKAPGLVHRLDRDTSGVMVVARTAVARERLTEQFRVHTVRKEYLALVHGRLAAARGQIDAPLRRDRKNRFKIVTCPPGEGRAALTLYRVKAAWADVALLEVEIRTGRTHQIRVHCAHLGHPVVADEMYGKGRTAHLHSPALRAAVEALGRQFLHAARLSFDHPTSSERLSFEAPLGPDLRAVLAALGG